MDNIGIFSGTFDPVHKGHIAFALKAAESAGLDKVYFMPEPVPRRKTNITHYAHRIAMLRLALKPYPKLAVLDMPDKQFSVNGTLPRLKKRFPEARIHLLIGSDVVTHLSSGAWPNADKLIKEMDLIVGMRRGEAEQEIIVSLQELMPERTFRIIKTGNNHVSSSDIRLAITRGKSHKSSLQVLDSYIKRNWIYASLDALPNNS